MHIGPKVPVIRPLCLQAGQRAGGSRKEEGDMEINERISLCLTSLESKQKSVDTFQARLRQMLDSLRKGGVTDGGVVDLLHTMDAVVKDYAEISQSCRQMIEGLREISE